MNSTDAVMGVSRASRRLFASSCSSIPVCNKAGAASIPVGRTFVENTCTHSDQTEFASIANCLRYSGSSSGLGSCVQDPTVPLRVATRRGGRSAGDSWVFWLRADGRCQTFAGGLADHQGMLVAQPVGVVKHLTAQRFKRLAAERCATL